MPSALPETLPVRDEPPAPALVERVRAALAEGGLVLMPTETVYGLAARVDRGEGLRRLAELKGADGQRPWTWHVGTRAAVEAFEPLRPLARRLVERYWPGPLTLVLRGVPPGLERVADDGWTGVRLPAHAATAGLLAALDFPVVLSSANRSGGAPATALERLDPDLAPELALVLDGGPSRLGEPSGCLRLGPGRFELLREGLLPVEDLRRTAGLGILFVCTGNTCRSPMAAGLARSVLAERLGVPGRPARIAQFGFAVDSAGVFASGGSPASAHAVTALGERGIDLSGHRSAPLEASVLERAERVYALTRGHLEALLERLGPEGRARVSLLDPDGDDVPDPIGGSLEQYRACAARLEELVRRRAAEWA